ncbi:MAG: bifunctional 3-deoxy-7-phosphoheptulonate synthase/chorismate mutase type II [Bacteroidia bacterium]
MTPQPALFLKPVDEAIPRKGKKFIIAGPCGAESEQQILQTVQDLARSGKVDLIRAGVWKPRTRPGTFEGRGEEALEWLAHARQLTGLPFMVEVSNTQHVEAALKFRTDALWIGARTTVNPFTVQEIADAIKGTDIPVFVKNPVNPDLQLWIGALERINRAGITMLAAIHRGFHTAVKTQYRNAPMWEQAIALKELFPELPVICDPSHISGRRELIRDVAQKAFDLTFDGLMVEVHPDPDHALSDAAQQLTPQDFLHMLNQLIIRDPKADDTNFEYMLLTLRQVIDEIDEEMLQALSRRMQVVERIGEFKAQHGVTILQIDRWLEMLRTRTDAGAALGLDDDIVVELCQLLHKASIRKQNEVMNRKQDEQHTNTLRKLEE